MKRLTLNGVATRGEATAPSAARHLDLFEAEQLKAIALALPDSWAVQILPPFGQLAITPLASRRVHHRCWTASRRWRAIRHENGVRPT